MPKLSNKKLPRSKTSQPISVGSLSRKLLKSVLNILPGNLVETLYTRVFIFPPLRYVVNKILVKTMPEFIDITDGRLFLNKKDPVLSGALSMGVFEKYFSEIFRKVLSKEMVVIDVGANLGYYTLISSKNCKKVFAFEPELENSNLLKKNLKYNKCNNVEVCEFALGDKNQLANLYIDPYNKGKHSFLKGSLRSKVTTKVSKLDSVLSSTGVKKVSIIKIDIEGWEAKAMIGMKQTIKNHKPLLFFEFVPDRITKSGENPYDLLHGLVELGYSLDIIDEDKYKLVPIVDIDKFVATFSGHDKYVNIFGYVNLPKGL